MTQRSHLTVSVTACVPGIYPALLAWPDSFCCAHPGALPLCLSRKVSEKRHSNETVLRIRVFAAINLSLRLACVCRLQREAGTLTARPATAEGGTGSAAGTFPLCTAGHSVRYSIRPARGEAGMPSRIVRPWRACRCARIMGAARGVPAKPASGGAKKHLKHFLLRF